MRQMLRTIFDDELLLMFRYVGQKKKKVFSSLNLCSIIFGKFLNELCKAKLFKLVKFIIKLIRKLTN